VLLRNCTSVLELRRLDVLFLIYKPTQGGTPNVYIIRVIKSEQGNDAAYSRVVILVKVSKQVTYS
jgi:hypothetical protein